MATKHCIRPKWPARRVTSIIQATGHKITAIRTGRITVTVISPTTTMDIATLTSPGIKEAITAIHMVAANKFDHCF